MPGAALEQSCQRPGLWYIEGHQVVRRGKQWWVYKPTWDGTKERVAVVPSLSDAREWVRQVINR